MRALVVRTTRCQLPSVKLWGERRSLGTLGNVDIGTGKTVWRQQPRVHIDAVLGKAMS